MKEETRKKISESKQGQVPWNKGKKGFQTPWMKGRKHTAESILKMSEAKKGKILGEKNPFYGKTHSEEAKRKNSEAHKGKLSPMKGKKTGKPSWNKGLTKETDKRVKNYSLKLIGKHNSPESIRKIIATRMQRGSYKHTEEQKKKVSLSLKGKKHSEESKKKMSLAQKKVWLNPEIRKRKSESQKGRRQSEENKKTHSEYMKKYFKTHKHPMLGKKQSKESIEKTRLKNLGRNPWNKDKKMPERSEWGRQNILKQYESGAFPRQENTKPERQIKAELIKRGYIEGEDFIHQYRFMDKFMCDFCFPKQKIVVEAYGDFWHANPKKYPIPIHKQQIKDIGRDKSKEAYIKKVDNGSWTLLIFWESDIKKDVKYCVDKIEKEFLK